MKIIRWSARIHKWITLLIGLQILAWILGGLIFSVLDIEKVRGEHKIRQCSVQPLDPDTIISLQTASKQASIDRVISAELGTMLGKPVWRIKTGDQLVTLDGISGHALSPIDAALAKDIAKGDYDGVGEFLSVTLVENPPSEYRSGGPVWVARFDDLDKTTLYIDPHSADVKSRRSRTWRVFDFFWKLHVMDYDDGESFNHPLLIIASFIALIVVLSGFVLLYFRMRRLIRSRRRQRNKMN